jgi:hypothetical protein
MYAKIFKTAQRNLMWFSLTSRVIQEEGVYVYNMHDIVEQHISNSIALVRSRDGSPLLIKY